LPATDRNGVLVETQVERRHVTGRQDVDHDYVRLLCSVDVTPR